MRLGFELAAVIPMLAYMRCIIEENALLKVRKLGTGALCCACMAAMHRHQLNLTRWIFTP